MVTPLFGGGSLTQHAGIEQINFCSFVQTVPDAGISSEHDRKAAQVIDQFQEA